MAYRVPGPCTVEWQSNGTTYNSIGVSKSGFVIRPNTALVPITDDGCGQAPATYLFGGKSCIVEVTGLDLTAIKDAELWGDDVLRLGTSVGELASVAGQRLKITERDGASIWIAEKAFPTDPRELGMKSTEEMKIPLTFVLICVSGKFFSTIPSYLV